MIDVEGLIVKLKASLCSNKVEDEIISALKSQAAQIIELKAKHIKEIQSLQEEWQAQRLVRPLVHRSITKQDNPNRLVYPDVTPIRQLAEPLNAELVEALEDAVKSLSTWSNTDDLAWMLYRFPKLIALSRAFERHHSITGKQND